MWRNGKEPIKLRDLQPTAEQPPEPENPFAQERERTRHCPRCWADLVKNWGSLECPSCNDSSEIKKMYPLDFYSLSMHGLTDAITTKITNYPYIVEEQLNSTFGIYELTPLFIASYYNRIETVNLLLCSRCNNWTRHDPLNYLYKCPHKVCTAKYKNCEKRKCEKCKKIINPIPNDLNEHIDRFINIYNCHNAKENQSARRIQNWWRQRKNQKPPIKYGPGLGTGKGKGPIAPCG